MFLNAPRKEIRLFFLIAFFQICGLIGVIFINRDLTLSLTPQNLLVTTFSIFFIYEDKIKMLRFFIFAFSIGFLVEVIGVNYGIIFGNYTYGSVLGFKVLNVPLMIGVNWFFLSIACGGISDMMFNKLLPRIFFASFLMVLLDLLIEPLAPVLNFWEFEGIVAPLKNYIGWFMTSFFIQLIYQKMKINFSPLFSVLVYLSQMGFFILLFFLI